MSVFARQTVHDRAYYVAALQVILAGLVTSRPQYIIVRMLADAGIHAPTGGAFTLDALKCTLKQLRHGRGRFYDALARSVLEGQMTALEARPLLQRQTNPALFASPFMDGRRTTA